MAFLPPKKPRPAVPPPTPEEAEFFLWLASRQRPASRNHRFPYYLPGTGTRSPYAPGAPADAIGEPPAQLPEEPTAAPQPQPAGKTPAGWTRAYRGLLNSPEPRGLLDWPEGAELLPPPLSAGLAPAAAFAPQPQPPRTTPGGWTPPAYRGLLSGPRGLLERSVGPDEPWLALSHDLERAEDSAAQPPLTPAETQFRADWAAIQPMLGLPPAPTPPAAPFPPSQPALPPAAPLPATPFMGLPPLGLPPSSLPPPAVKQTQLSPLALLNAPAPQTARPPLPPMPPLAQSGTPGQSGQSRAAALYSPAPPVHDIYSGVPAYKRDYFRNNDQGQNWVDFIQATGFLPQVSTAEKEVYREIYAAEGGNVPNGLTVAGITSGALQDLKDDIPGLTESAQPAYLTPSQQAQFYKAYLGRTLSLVGGWESFEDLNDPGAVRYLADTLFREGRTGGAQLIQDAINDFYGVGYINRKGPIGPETLQALHMALKNPESKKGFLEHLYFRRLLKRPNEWPRNQYFYQRAFE